MTDSTIEYAALFVGPVAALVAHGLLRRRYMTACCLAGALTGLCVTFVIPPLINFGVSNLWPMACAVWLVYGFRAAIFVGLPILAWRGREPPPGRCLECGYDLRGLPEPRCPEWGTAFSMNEAGKQEHRA